MPVRSPRRWALAFLLGCVAVLFPGLGLASGMSWTNVTVGGPWPAYVGYTSIHYDTLRHRMLIWGPELSSSSAYGTTMWEYRTGFQVFTRLGGGLDNSGQPMSVSTCPQAMNLPPTVPAGQVWADNTPTWPGPRNAGSQMVWDSFRNQLWLTGGNCSGLTYADLYTYDSASETWTQRTASTYPTYLGKSFVHDTDSDVLFLFGTDGAAQTHTHFVYCPTDLNPTPGTLTAAQAAAGCSGPDDWTDITSTVGLRPRGVAFPGLIYDPVTRKAILFGGADSIETYNETWAYDVPTHTWQNRDPVDPPAPPAHWPEPALAYHRPTGWLLYHEWSGSGAPADWAYNPVANTWTRFAVGTGFVYQGTSSPLQTMAYDPDTDLVVAWSYPVNADSTLYIGRADLTTLSTLPPSELPFLPVPTSKVPPYSVGCACGAPGRASRSSLVVPLLLALALGATTKRHARSRCNFGSDLDEGVVFSVVATRDPVERNAQ